MKFPHLKISHNGRHNPYFNRWFSAMQNEWEEYTETHVTILILIDGFLQ